MLINYHTSNLMYQISVCQIFSPNYMKENSSSNHLHLLNFVLTCKLAAGNAINILSSYTKFQGQFRMSANFKVKILICFVNFKCKWMNTHQYSFLHNLPSWLYSFVKFKCKWMNTHQYLFLHTLPSWLYSYLTS